MKQDLMDILACPICKGTLILTSEVMDGDEILDGSLKCGQCDDEYPINGGIPNFLPLHLRS